MNCFKKRIKDFLFLSIVLMVNKQVNCQVIQNSGDIFTEISTVISIMPGSSGDNYSAPNLSQLNTWTIILDNLLQGNYTVASDSANTLAYDLIEFMDTTSVPNVKYYILKTNNANYWGTYIYNPNYCRPLVIQSPHPKKDLNTGKQGVYIFKKTRALFFCLSGTNRCNSSLYSSCDGTTSVCSASSEDYRISDLAHNTSTIFQSTTNKLFNYFNDTHFIQLHGFSKLSTDPYLILSNGTQITPSTDNLSTFKSKLFDEDNSLTFKVAHLDLTWTRLRGFYNVQGRLLNTSSDFCNSNAIATNGRFFHIEQEKTKLRDDSIGWDKVANALKNTFTCSSLLFSKEEGRSKLKIYPNPATNIISIKGDDININDIKIYNMLGQEMNEFILITDEDQKSVKVRITELHSGMYIIKVKTSVNIIYKQ